MKMDNLNFPLSFTRESCVWEGRNIFECNVQLHLDLRKLKMNLSFLNSKWIFEQFSTVTLISLHFNFLFSIPSTAQTYAVSASPVHEFLMSQPSASQLKKPLACQGSAMSGRLWKRSAGQQDCFCGWEASCWTGETRSRDNSRSKNPPVRQQAGHSAIQLHPSFWAVLQQAPAAAPGH